MVHIMHLQNDTGQSNTINILTPVLFLSYLTMVTLHGNILISSRMYQNRKKAKNGVKVKLDLTRRRRGILTQAIEFGEKHELIDFVFTDVNCNLAVRLKDGGFVYFESLDVLKQRVNGP